MLYTAQSVLNCMNVLCCSHEINAEHCTHGGSFENTHLVWDIWASLGLTPYKADFLDSKQSHKDKGEVSIQSVICKF